MADKYGLNWLMGSDDPEYDPYHNRINQANQERLDKLNEERSLMQDNRIRSKIDVRFDLIPASSILVISQILADGAVKYGLHHWQSYDADDHLNHALNHIYQWLNGDRSENHLGNASCRLLFALFMSMQ
jgi:hypothetical protein